MINLPGLTHLIMKLPFAYYQNPDVLFLARDLLGKVLCTNIDGEISKGIIVETEAYYGVQDKASHAYGGRRTPRTEVMFGEGGTAYVYLCYGIHFLFNVVTSVAGQPHAVLVRGIEPFEGVSFMERRRSMPASKGSIGAGPGSAAMAMGINLQMNKKDLCGEEIWIEDHGLRFQNDAIVTAPRVGVAYAGADALLPWRFYIEGNRYVSKPNKSLKP